MVSDLFRGGWWRSWQGYIGLLSGLWLGELGYWRELVLLVAFEGLVGGLAGKRLARNSLFAGRCLLFFVEAVMGFCVLQFLGIDHRFLLDLRLIFREDLLVRFGFCCGTAGCAHSRIWKQNNIGRKYIKPRKDFEIQL